MLDATRMAAVLAPLDVPAANVLANWPGIATALEQSGVDDRLTEIAAAATVVVETGVTIAGVNRTFTPIEELGDEAYFRGELGDQWWYHGRGYVQTTWLSNYRRVGALLKLDLVQHPDLLLQPGFAAQALAIYFRDHGLRALADAGDWVGVREAVNGGLNGWNVFWPAVQALLALPDGPPVTRAAVLGPLYRGPSMDSGHAIDPRGAPVLLQVGQVVAFTPDPHTGKETTPHWAHIALPASPVHGWVERDHLSTTGG